MKKDYLKLFSINFNVQIPTQLSATCLTKFQFLMIPAILFTLNLQTKDLESISKY